MENKKAGLLVLTLGILLIAPRLWADQPAPVPKPSAPAPLATLEQTDAAQTVKYKGPALTGEDISPLSDASQ